MFSPPPQGLEVPPLLHAEHPGAPDVVLQPSMLLVDSDDACRTPCASKQENTLDSGTLVDPLTPEPVPLPSLLTGRGRVFNPYSRATEDKDKDYEQRCARLRDLEHGQLDLQAAAMISAATSSYLL